MKNEPISLPRVIPTDLHFNTLSDLAFHLIKSNIFSHFYCILMHSIISHSYMFSDILSDISGISSCIRSTLVLTLSSGVLSGILSGILYDVLSGTHVLSGNLSDTDSWILAFWQSIRHLRCHSSGPVGTKRACELAILLASAKATCRDCELAMV